MADAATNKSYVFGPVPSRRLGRSLGVDIVPFKTCTYDCIYCQLGRTTCKTTERQDCVPVDDVMDQVKAALPAQPDYITLSGSGEPTLNVRIGEVIRRVKQLTDIPVAVLTNGSLLCDKAVRLALLEADLVLPSLDAGDEAMFQAVNRPHEDISFRRMLDGLVQFRDEFQGQYWLEVFLVTGYTADETEVAKIAGRVDLVSPSRIHLNTITRPPAESAAVAVSRDRMAKLAEVFGPHAEVVADFPTVHDQPAFAASRQDVLEMLRRRPCTIEDVAAGLGMHRNEAIKYIEELMTRNMLEEESISRRPYYRAKR